MRASAFVPLIPRARKLSSLFRQSRKWGIFPYFSLHKLPCEVGRNIHVSQLLLASHTKALHADRHRASQSKLQAVRPCTAYGNHLCGSSSLESQSGIRTPTVIDAVQAEQGDSPCPKELSVFLPLSPLCFTV